MEMRELRKRTWMHRAHTRKVQNKSTVNPVFSAGWRDICGLRLKSHVTAYIYFLIIWSRLPPNFLVDHAERPCKNEKDEWVKTGRVCERGIVSATSPPEICEGTMPLAAQKKKEKKEKLAILQRDAGNMRWLQSGSS